MRHGLVRRRIQGPAQQQAAGCDQGQEQQEEEAPPPAFLPQSRFYGRPYGSRRRKPEFLHLAANALFK